MATTTLDAKGLNCPLPIMKAKKSLKGLTSGDVLEVLSTDPGSVKDFESFCKATGHSLLETDEQGEGNYRFLIEKK